MAISNEELDNVLNDVKKEYNKPADETVADFIAKHEHYSAKQFAEHFHMDVDEIVRIRTEQAEEIKTIRAAFRKAKVEANARAVADANIPYRKPKKNPVMKAEAVMAAREMAEGKAEEREKELEMDKETMAQAVELAEDIAKAKSVKEMKNEDPNFVLVPEAPAEKPKKVAVQEPLPEGGVRVSFKDRGEDEEDRCGACSLKCDIPTKPCAVISDMVPAEPKADYSALKEFARAAFGLDEPNVEQHRAITRSMTEMYKRKNHDYGDSFHKLYGEFGPVYLVMHLSEKLERVKTLMKDGNLVVGESMKDSLMDIANYAVMGVMEIGESAKC